MTRAEDLVSERFDREYAGAGALLAFMAIGLAFSSVERARTNLLLAGVTNMATQARPLAVVTGASSGIGLELAKLCA